MSHVAGDEAVRRAAALARSARRADGMPLPVIAIDGAGGAGKSTLAARVAARLDAVTVIHTDDFASWDNPLEWWPRLLDQVLQPLKRDRPARYQRYDWDLRQLAEWHDVPRRGVLVIEGVGAARRELRPYLAASIWVDAARDVRLRRGLERDGPQARDRWRQWQADEDRYIERHRSKLAADLVVSGENGVPWPGPTRPDKAA